MLLYKKLLLMTFGTTLVHNDRTLSVCSHILVLLVTTTNSDY